MEGNLQSDELMSFVSALADAERLKIIGVLAVQRSSLSQVAATLNLKPADVSHHLQQLIEAGLVSSKGDQYYLDVEALNTLSRNVLADLRPRLTPNDFEGEAFERKVLSDYMTPQGSLKQLPTQYKKLLVVLRYMLQAFEPGERYPEKQVNLILRRYYPDTASIRRYMVDEGLMAREKGVYWRV